MKKQEPQKSNVELLPNGILRVHNLDGYTDYDSSTRLIVGAKCYSDEEPEPKKSNPKQNQKSSRDLEKENRDLQVQLARMSLENDEPIVVEPKKAEPRIDSKKERPQESDAPTPLVLSEINNKEVDLNIESWPVKIIDELPTMEEPQVEAKLNIEPRADEEQAMGQWIETVVKKVTENELYTSDEKIIDHQLLAQAIGGKPKAPKQKKEASEPKEKPRYHIGYKFSTLQNFFNFFGNENSGTSEEKTIKFLDFLFKHDNIFLADKKIFVHVDSLVIAFARTVEPEYRADFLNALFVDGYISFELLGKHLYAYGLRQMSKLGTTIFHAPQKEILIFSRAIKVEQTIYIGSFAHISCSNEENKSLLERVDMSWAKEEGSVLANKPEEIEKVKGKKIPLMTQEEMLNVL